ncbi:hypothetical protein [Kibdelosporangium philippinense]|uniref:hypothetical protein n=1 Tax=Kibdelosporangium philippinense TaxID=211113 RepID=UPI003614FB27
MPLRELSGLHQDDVDLNRGTISVAPRVGTLHERSQEFVFATQSRKGFGPAHSSAAYSTPPSTATKPCPNDVSGLSPLDRDRPSTAYGTATRTGSSPTAHPKSPKARRLGHPLTNRVTEVYSHVATEVELRLHNDLQHRWHTASLNVRAHPAPSEPAHRHLSGPLAANHKSADPTPTAQQHEGHTTNPHHDHQAGADCSRTTNKVTTTRSRGDHPQNRKDPPDQHQ